jgi:hypothetical protein
MGEKLGVRALSLSEQVTEKIDKHSLAEHKRF